MPESLPPNLRTIGRYTIVRELRRDAVSVSYHAVDAVLHREVIIKAVQLPLPAEAGPGRDAEISVLEAAFSRQAQAAGKLSHPHIVAVHEAGRLHQIGYLAIERVAGRKLHELIASGWRPQFVQAASIAARIADAIDYAHQQHIAHGHLGPQHVTLREENNEPKIDGFGGWIDSGRAGNEALERTERLLPYFDVLPEEMRTRDIRSIVSLLHMMLTGRAPATPETAEPKEEGAAAERRNGASARDDHEIPPVKLLRPDTPAPLARLIDETLNNSARTRITTAADLRDALTSFIWNERATHAPATVGVPLAPTAIGPRTNERERPPRTRTTTVSRPLTPIVPSESGSLLERLGFVPVPYGTAFGLLIAGLALGVLITSLAHGGRVSTPPAAVAPPPAEKSAGVGTVMLDIKPWGEVLVDGAAVGVSPPLTELKLPAGRHRVEIRHGEKQAVTANVDIDPAQPRRIEHRFAK